MWAERRSAAGGGGLTDGPADWHTESRLRAFRVAQARGRGGSSDVTGGATFIKVVNRTVKTRLEERG
ncbi:hypothetical protein CRENBAI_017766 [Crenichthys baileyi]|uniref:Uncharacterized protein n=1 Tax=Crenichthys baileyi TaxID=28760 RepID=A0AAV9R170_9TELE